MTSRCMLILPYFGKFNNYFPLFLRSCGANPSFDFLIITDDATPYDYPTNVHVVRMTFAEFKAKAAQKLGFEPCLPSPYKLCDFKPAYGLLFEEYLDGYDYWGHCDCDLIFGNLDKFVTPILDKGFDKVFAAGHLTIYRNNKDNNRRFMKPLSGELIYKQAFTTDRIFVFDEDNPDPDKNPDRKNVHSIFLQDHASIYTEDLSMNVSMLFSKIVRSYYSPEIRNFKRETYIPARYYWKDGNIYSLSLTSDKKIICKDYPYMHFHSRILRVSRDVFRDSIFEILSDKIRSVKRFPSSAAELRLWKLHLPSTFWFDVYQRRIMHKLKKIIGKTNTK